MNKTTSDNDIIVALATPYGKSAIAAIRISGFGCIEFTDAFLSRRLEVGKMKTYVFRNGDFSERLMAVCFKAPKSYTGEDTVELYPHGNMTVCDLIVSALIDGGARAAERGEFTKRAFINGKLDLMQCEALADIIDADTAEQLKYGNMRFDGEFKSLFRVEKLLERALSGVEAVLHYSDELEENEIDGALVGDVSAAIDQSISLLKAELDGYDGGRIINDGFKIALIGVPNVGKSTLLNALLGKDRAIVTPIAGTTRDTIDGEYVYKGKKFVVVDTAGITDTDDTVEKIGVTRAKAAAEEADVVVAVTDRTEAAADVGGIKTVKVINKCDGAADVGEDYSAAERNGAIEISAKNGINITALKQKLYDMTPKNCGGLCNHRQYDCAKRALISLEEAKAESKKAESLEIVSAALYDAFSCIEDLFGIGEPDEKIIGAVFDRFCVGK